MSDDTKLRRLQEGYQPSKDELTRGYRPTQQVDLSNLKIPSNLGDAAVTPANGAHPAPTPAKTDKE
jgi:hypothetical protein